MRTRFVKWILCAAPLLLGSCASPKAAEPSAKLTVAAAANLTEVFGELGRVFKAKTGVEVIFSYGRSNDKLKRLGRGAQGNARAGMEVS